MDSTSIEKEFKEIYFSFYPLAVKTAIYILKDSTKAEDVVQNVFLKLWDKRDNLEQIDNPKSYILQMSRNGALDLISKENYASEDKLMELCYEDSAGERTEEIKEALQKAISELTPNCRLIFSLSRLEGLSNPEIAEHLSISVRTVETQISTALKRFRTDLRHYFIELLGFLLVFSHLISG